MAEHHAPRLTKWPFFLGDLVLLGAAAWIAFKCPTPFALWPLTGLVLCVVAGAWLSVTPFLVEYRAQLRFAETNYLANTVEQIQQLNRLAVQINSATAQWQSNQDQAARTATIAHEITERITGEAKAFSETMLKANDAEKNQLRLEVEKLRRAEGDWLQTVVRMLDHVFMLYQAGVKSGQGTLREQLGSFQHACRDLARRLGLVPFEARPGDVFNGQVHRLANPEEKPPAEATIGEVLAPGFTYQGRLLRCALVSLAGTSVDQQVAAAEEDGVKISDPELPPEGSS